MASIFFFALFAAILAALVTPPRSPLTLAYAHAAPAGPGLGQRVAGAASHFLRLALGFFGTQATSGGGFTYKYIFEGKKQQMGLQKKISPSNAAYTPFIDAQGYLKPGTLLKADLLPVTAGSQVVVYVVGKPTKVAYSNASGDRTQDQLIGLWTEGRLSKADIEFNLERVLTADEIAAVAANSRFLLV